MNKAFGVIKEIIPHTRDYEYERVCGASATTFPEEFEIPRTNTGSDKDQGSVGACVAEVIAQISEELWKRQLGDQEEHSEGFIYAKFRSEGSKGYGLVPSIAMKAWMDTGTLPKKYYDKLYEMPDMRDIIDKFPEFDEIAKRYRISGFVRLYKDAEIKDALTKNLYGLVGISHEYFGESHAIEITGWKDKTDCYKFKNSWGKDYRDNGYGELPKAELDAVYLPLLDDVKLPFVDVPEDAWYYKPIKNMYFNGFANGKSENTFEPESFLTRAEGFALQERTLKSVDKNNDIINRKIAMLEEQIKNIKRS
jgi:hypothetical protein